MLVGWGEGLDLAADYLNALPDARQLRVTTWFWNDAFAYMFKGEAQEGTFAPSAASILQWSAADYSVLYISQLQRGLYSRELLEYFASQTPVLIGRIHDLEYVRVYDLHKAPFPEFLLRDDSRFVDWSGAVRLVTYEPLEGSIAPGRTVRVAFCFKKLIPADRDLRLNVRLIDAHGHEIQRSEGALTARSTERDVWLVEHQLAVPRDALPGTYQIELSLYEPQSSTFLSARRTRTGEVLGSSVVVGSVQL